MEKYSDYTSSSTGKCKPLTVQSVNPSLTNDWIEQDVRSSAPPSTRFAAWLTRDDDSTHPGKPLCGYSSGSVISSHYCFHLWEASRVYLPLQSVFDAVCEDDGLVRRVTHALYPRFLVVYDGQTRTWTTVNVEAVVRRQPYVAITYSYHDMMKSENGVEVLIQRSRDATLDQGFDAYWLDLECLLEDPAQKAKTCFAWRIRELRYKAGNNAVTPITLTQLASLAYSHHDEESQSSTLLASGKDPLERLEPAISNSKKQYGADTASASQLTAEEAISQGRYRAEKVYALMGFFEHRILPNAEETELQALARLFMANDNDRIAGSHDLNASQR
ncbi:hypothetical protein DFH29DRAFT_1024849 [Suillus ampliporus]|nr:hypothetical protein DFH29DRAFT_1024849 [Suillus ampliporus]